MRRDESERLFVEALLGSIGHMAFWCHGGEFAERMDALLKAGESPAQAELAVLGMTLRQFSRELLHAWDLDAVLTDSPEVAMAEGLSRAAQQDWGNPEARKVTQRIATLLKQPIDETLSRLQHNAEQACLLATALGASAVTKWIATPAAASEGDAPEADAAPQPAAEPAPPQADPSLQLRMLTEMSTVAGSRKDLPMLFEASLEGLHRAVGLDRCVLCLMTPARDRLLARLGAGLGVVELRARLQLQWSALLESELQAGGSERSARPPRGGVPLPRNIERCEEGSAMRWYTAEQPPPIFLSEAVGVSDCFIATLTVDQKIIGLFLRRSTPHAEAVDRGRLRGVSPICGPDRTDRARTAALRRGQACGAPAAHRSCKPLPLSAPAFKVQDDQALCRRSRPRPKAQNTDPEMRCGHPEANQVLSRLRASTASPA